MNKEEFIKFCKKKFPRISTPRQLQNIGLEESVWTEEATGGIRGGSCWDTGEFGDPHYAYTREYDDSGVGPDLISLVEELVPDLPAVAFFKLQSGVKTDTYSEYEYYGNSTDYKVWYISFEDVWDKIGNYLEKVELKSDADSGTTRKRKDDVG